MININFWSRIFDMKKVLAVLLLMSFLATSSAYAQDDAINTENGEVENMQIPAEKQNKKDKQPTSADLVRQHNKIEKLEYSKKIKQRELDYLNQLLEEKKQELEKFNNETENTKEETEEKGEEK